MHASGSSESNRAYYDAFSARYDDRRGRNDPGGYHELLDELEADFVERFGANGDVLEVGCGTGLLLDRIRQYARSATGIDLSPGMLDKARARGLDVIQGSATALPFGDDSFDVTCSFKVLAHIPEVGLALAEMARVTRPGGVIIAEFYNPYSLRGLLKRFGPAGSVAAHTTERDVFLRFDSPWAVRTLLPPSCQLIASRGVRVAVPTAAVMRVALLRNLFRAAEWMLCDSALSVFGGFWIAALRKNGGADASQSVPR
jgi:ubiquinone/menaquinone biosynthesis C-methylase UbiE